MKIRLLLALVGLAIGFAVPTLAQQKETVDPQIIEQLVALGKKYAEAVDNNDAAAVAALYTEDAVDVADTGPICGREPFRNIGQTRSRKCISANSVQNGSDLFIYNSRRDRCRHLNDPFLVRNFSQFWDCQRRNSQSTGRS
jgi:hypothetical protein